MHKLGEIEVDGYASGVERTIEWLGRTERNGFGWKSCHFHVKMINRSVSIASALPGHRCCFGCVGYSRHRFSSPPSQLSGFRTLIGSRAIVLLYFGIGMDETAWYGGIPNEIFPGCYTTAVRDRFEKRR